MKIREVLEADWTVDRIEVTVRNKETTRYIMQYCIGKDMKPGSSEKFDYEAECGDVYQSCGMRNMYIKRIIQFRQLEEKPQGKDLCVGVLLNEIPKEILELEVGHMTPYRCGTSDGLHGYYFDCYVDRWDGIQGENKQMELFEGL